MNRRQLLGAAGALVCPNPRALVVLTDVAAYEPPKVTVVGVIGINRTSQIIDTAAWNPPPGFYRDAFAEGLAKLAEDFGE